MQKYAKVFANFWSIYFILFYFTCERGISHPPGGRLSLLFAMPAVTFPAEDRNYRQLVLLGDQLVFKEN